MKANKLNSKELLNSKSFCMVPFVHSCVWTDGRVIPCCLNHSVSFGHVKTNSLSEIYSQNNKTLVDFRKEMLESTELPSSCYRCKIIEDLNLGSVRQNANLKFQQHFDELKINEDNVLEEEHIVYWDVRFSNLCNLKCRMCDSTNSSKIAEEEVRTGKDIPVMRQAFDNADDFYNFFKKQIDNLEEIIFCGGEPLLLDEHYKILDFLIEHKKFNVKMIYYSNCTKLTFKNKNIVNDYWKYFNNIQLSASIDAGGNHLSYIRHGTDWDTIKDNLLLIKKECPNLKIEITPTVQILNAFSCPQMFLDLVKLGVTSPEDFKPIILTMPPGYNLTALPAELKEKVRDHWNWFKDELIKLLAPQNVLDAVDGIINHMYSSDTQIDLVKLKKDTIFKDDIRKENFLNTFPELSTLFDGVE